MQDDLEPIEEIKIVEQKLIDKNNWIEKGEIDDYIENLKANQSLEPGHQKKHSYEMIVQKWLQIQYI